MGRIDGSMLDLLSADEVEADVTNEPARERERLIDLTRGKRAVPSNISIESNLFILHSHRNANELKRNKTIIDALCQTKINRRRREGTKE